MNILVFGNGSLSVAQQERKLCVEFAKAGHSVHLICNETTRLFDVGELESHKNLHLINLPHSEYRFEYLQIDEKIDVCLGMDQSVVPFVAEYKNRTNVKSYCMFLDFPVHVIDGKDTFNYNFGYSQRFYYWLNCSLELDGVIFNNSVAVDEFRKRYKREAHLVLYAISNDNAIDKFTEPPTNDYVVGCNRVIKYKGTEYTLQALRRLKYDYKHIFVSADKKEMENLKAISSGIKQSVAFYERADEDRKMELIYNAKLLVYPQITQWIGGLSILEGWSVETPGICFDFPVLRELYGDCVLYARPHSAIDLRDQIRTLYEDKDIYDDLVERGRERFKKYFTRSVMAKNLLGVISG